MQYQRPLQRTEGFKPFDIGTHQATITKIRRKKSSRENDMFLIFLEGMNEERGVYFLTFGTEYTDENLAFLLASIEDGGVDIPAMNFGYNRETYEFLLNKDVLIAVELQSYKGEIKPTVTKFLTLDEFEQSVPVEEATSEEW